MAKTFSLKTLYTSYFSQDRTNKMLVKDKKLNKQ